MSADTLEIPAEAPLAMRGEPEAVKTRLLLAAAAKLFELVELSSGAAARFAGIPRTVFLTRFAVDTFKLS